MSRAPCSLQPIVYLTSAASSESSGPGCELAVPVCDAVAASELGSVPWCHARDGSHRPAGARRSGGCRLRRGPAWPAPRGRVSSRARALLRSLGGQRQSAEALLIPSHCRPCICRHPAPGNLSSWRSRDTPAGDGRLTGFVAVCGDQSLRPVTAPPRNECTLQLGRVQVEDASGHVIAREKLDSDGRFALKLPRGHYRLITWNAGMGRGRRRSR